MKIKFFSITCFTLLIFFGLVNKISADECETLTTAQINQETTCTAAIAGRACANACAADSTAACAASYGLTCAEVPAAATQAEGYCAEWTSKLSAAESAVSNAGKTCEDADATPAATASAGTPTTAQELPNPLVDDNATKLTALQVVGYALRAMLGMLGAVTLLMFVYGGFMLVWAHGNEEMIKKGQSTLLWAVIGMGFVLSSYALLKYLFDLIQKT